MTTVFLSGFDMDTSPPICGVEVFSTDAENPTTPSMTVAQFRARQATLSLTPEQRLAVQLRPRFYRIPWIHPTNIIDPEDTVR